MWNDANWVRLSASARAGQPIAWHQKRHLVRLTKDMVATFQLPISELVEALAMSTSHQKRIQQKVD
jgi:hypothetical protein